MPILQSIQGSSSGNIAEVDANNQLKVVLSNVANNMGSVRIQSEVDPGTIVGAPTLRSPETSSDYRLRTGLDNLWDFEVFNYAAQNTSKHLINTTTMTTAYSGGFFFTNNSGITTINTGVQFRTYRHFPLIGTTAVYLDFDLILTETCPTNTILEFGFGIHTNATSGPTDGVFFRYASAGLVGVINNNGSETLTSVMTFTPSANVSYNYTIAVNRGVVEFWINDVLYGSIVTPAGVGTPVSAVSQPVSINHRIGGTAAGSATFKAKFANYTVTSADIPLNRPYHVTQAGLGLNAIQGASGMTQGTTASYTNSTVPSTAAVANTTASYATLGGAWQIAAQANSEVDYILFAYLNPAPTTAITGRNLMITSVMIDSFIANAASSNTSTTLQWTVATGTTTVTMATAEGVNARAPRRLPIGCQWFPATAVVGQCADKRIEAHFDAPLCVESNSYFHVILRIPVTTATTNQIIRGVVGVNGYWE